MSRFRGFSPEHEGKRNSKKSKTASKPTEEAPSPAPLLPRVLSDDERRALRIRQLTSSTSEREALLRDRSLEVERPNSLSYNTTDGMTVAPLVRGKHQDKQPQFLERDPDLIDDDNDMVLGRIAAISVTDQAIQRFDNLMTQATSAIRNLRQGAIELVNSVTKNDPASGGADGPAKQIEMIISRVVEPWMMELEDNLKVLVEGTQESQSLEQPQQPQQQQPRMNPPNG
jgi:hypothetical protein